MVVYPAADIFNLIRLDPCTLRHCSTETILRKVQKAYHCSMMQNHPDKTRTRAQGAAKRLNELKDFLGGFQTSNVDPDRVAKLVKMGCEDWESRWNTQRPQNFGSPLDASEIAAFPIKGIFDLLHLNPHKLRHLSLETILLKLQKACCLSIFSTFPSMTTSGKSQAGRPKIAQRLRDFRTFFCHFQLSRIEPGRVTTLVEMGCKDWVLRRNTKCTQNPNSSP